MSEAFEFREVDVADVVIEGRSRADFGDMDALAESIDTYGLLHPIGVTPSMRLIYGERRLRAFRDLLHHDAIPAFVIDVDAIDALEMERAENDCRKEMTVSEKVALADAIAAAVGSRQGERTDRPKPARKAKVAKKAASERAAELPDNYPEVDPDEDADELVEKFPQVEPGEKTREAVARAAGFGNERTMRQAEAVVRDGVPELVAAMDDGSMSVNAAAHAAALAPEAQREVVARVREGGKPSEAVRDVAGEASPVAEAARGNGHALALLRGWVYGVAELVASMPPGAPGKINLEFAATYLRKAEAALAAAK